MHLDPMSKRLALASVLVAGLMGVCTAHAIELGLPADCQPGVDCFFQQYPDMLAGEGARDPFCRHATYEDHNGTDLRLRSMSDMERGVSVLAAAGGTVLRVRDGVPDRLVDGQEERAAVAGRECGNGVVIGHGDGYQTQYCHLRRSSVTVRPGQTVRRGDKIGEIGASGFAQFPHVHLAVRKEGETVDPSTGRFLSQGCAPERDEFAPLFAADIALLASRGGTDLLGFGLAGEPVVHAELTISGPPDTAAREDDMTVAWAWFINLEAGDRIRLELVGPDGNTIASHVSDPFDRSKASYSAFVGKRGAPEPGAHRVSVALIRDNAPLIERSGRAMVD